MNFRSRCLIFGLLLLCSLVAVPAQASPYVWEHDVPALAGFSVMPLAGGGIDVRITLDSADRPMEGLLEAAVKVDGYFIDGQALWVTFEDRTTVQMVLQSPQEAAVEVHAAWTHMGRQYLLGETHWPARIRVGIMTSGFRSLYHKELQLHSSESMVLEGLEGTSHHRVDGVILLENTGSEVLAKLPDGSLLVFTQGLRVSSDSVAKLAVPSIQRGDWRSFTPEYRGFFEVTGHKDGLLLVNEAPLEEYLYQVLPSEMPTGWPASALEAQAIVARSYAVVSAQQGRYRSLGFHVDDSHSFQVYNNSAESVRATAAIDATAGIIMRSLYDGQPVQGTYYSTSPGASASASEIWRGGNSTYLRFRTLSEDVPDEGWQELDDPAEWLRDSEGSGFDERSPYFRWQVYLSQAQLQQSLGRIVRGGVAAIESLIVVERGQAGNVMLLQVESGGRSHLLEGDYEIRQSLAPRTASLELNSGDMVDNLSLLPSSFFALEEDRGRDGRLVGVHVYGGGSGHGVGMSQWAALGMAEAGLSAAEILHSFFSEVELAPVTGIYRSLEKTF